MVLSIFTQTDYHLPNGHLLGNQAHLAFIMQPHSWHRPRWFSLHFSQIAKRFCI